MDKSLTVEIPREIYDELKKRKKRTGASISFQVNEILKLAIKLKGETKCKLQK